MKKRRRRRFPTDELLGLELDDVLEEHEHVGEIAPNKPGAGGAEFAAKKNRKTMADRIDEKRKTNDWRR